MTIPLSVLLSIFLGIVCTILGFFVKAYFRRLDDHIAKCDKTPNSTLLLEIENVKSDLASKHSENKRFLETFQKDLTSVKTQCHTMNGQIQNILGRMSQKPSNG